MPQLAISPVDVLVVVGVGAAGFLVVAIVCAGILALLQLILPSTDSGAAAVDAANAAAEGADSAAHAEALPGEALDAEGDA